VSEKLKLIYSQSVGPVEDVFYGISQSRDVHGYVLLVLGIAFRENGLNYPTPKKAIDAFLTSYSKAAKPKKNKAA
jgi:hypothetical protein